MKYLAILGRQPELSLAELESMLGPEHIEPLGAQALLDHSYDLAKLGGTVKLAKLVSSGPDRDQLLNDLIDQLPADGKLTLGLSYYGRRAEPLQLGMQLKKQLRSAGHSVRLVLPKPGQKQLSAAQLKYNHLATAEAPEILIVEQSGRCLIALTEQFQDIDAYSARDFTRPDRDAKVGMLPPKLAQILINLSGVTLGTILDPFCGSGVVLQEARLMGFAALGSDINPAMVKAARANMVWLDEQRPGLPKWQVEVADATSASLPPSAAIVTEGDLGPAFSGQPSTAALALASQSVAELVTRFLANVQRQTKPGCPVVLCVPSWQRGPETVSPPVIDEINRLGYTLRQFRHTDGQQLIYHRPGQHVGRQILVMRR